MKCKHYTYIIYSESIDRYYIGSTYDLQLRLKRHNEGWTKSTKNGIPWQLVYYEIYPTKSEAIRREYHIKRMKSRKYLESLLKDDDNPPEVVPTCREVSSPPHVSAIAQ